MQWVGVASRRAAETLLQGVLSRSATSSVSTGPPRSTFTLRLAFAGTPLQGAQKLTPLLG